MGGKKDKKAQTGAPEKSEVKEVKPAPQAVESKKPREPQEWFFNFPNMMFWAIVLRFGFLALNEMFSITTDVDYHVYTEGAAELLKQGGNPYSRFTYRYTPLLAYMMIPNLQLPFFGKILFNLFDLAAIFYMNLFLKNVLELSTVSRNKALAFWALNPFMAYINGRGSCESISLLLLAMMLYHIKLAMDKKAEHFNILLAGVFYGLLIHFRLYPVIFGLTLYIHINRQRFFPRMNIILFGAVAVAVNAFLISFFYQQYGQIFLDECFLYHLKRKDPRHNYSIFWITTVYEYFADPTEILIKNANLIILAVRLTLIVLVALTFRRNYLYALFIQTFIFTTLNTVYTAQYVIWEIQLLPYLLIENDSYSKKKSLGFWLLILLWFVNLEFWTLQSSKFEHQGENSFYLMHGANLGYFLIRVLFAWFVVENRTYKYLF